MNSLEKQTDNEILRNIDELKQMISSLGHAIETQQETIDRLSGGINKMNNELVVIESELDVVRTNKVLDNRIGYLRLFFPVLSTSSFWFLGPKVGIVASTASYLLYKII
jgi:hypothetical protein